MNDKAPTRDDVVHLFGQLSDHVVVEILGVGATYADLEEVALRLAQENDVLGEMRRPLDGAAAQVFDILKSVEDFGEERDRDRGDGVG